MVSPQGQLLFPLNCLAIQMKLENLEVGPGVVGVGGPGQSHHADLEGSPPASGERIVALNNRIRCGRSALRQLGGNERIEAA